MPSSCLTTGIEETTAEGPSGRVCAFCNYDEYDYWMQKHVASGRVNWVPQWSGPVSLRGRCYACRQFSNALAGKGHGALANGPPLIYFQSQWESMGIAKQWSCVWISRGVFRCIFHAPQKHTADSPDTSVAQKTLRHHDIFHCPEL